MRVQTYLCSGESFLPALRTVTLSLCTHMASPQCMYRALPHSLPLKATNPIMRVEVRSNLTLITFKGPISKCQNIGGWGGGGQGLNIHDLGGRPHKHSIHCAYKFETSMHTLERKINNFETEDSVC